MTYQNFIFDVDGTLWEVADTITRGWNRGIAKEYGKEDLLTEEWMRAQLGKTSDAILKVAMPDLSDAEIASLIKACTTCEHEVIWEETQDRFYPGVRETLKALSERACVYVVSNCSEGYIELMLRKGDLASYVLDFECFGNTRQGKAENIRLLMERNNLRDGETVYIGDTQMDYEATLKAKVPFVFAAYGLGEADGYDAKIDTIDEILQFSKA